MDNKEIHTQCHCERCNAILDMIDEELQNFDPQPLAAPLSVQEAIKHVAAKIELKQMKVKKKSFLAKAIGL